MTFNGANRMKGMKNGLRGGVGRGLMVMLGLFVTSGWGELSGWRVRILY
jgi:hypothetical protein